MPDDPRRLRVFLLGLDAATFTILRPWAEQGHLPTLARLMREGAWGTLLSTTPASTPLAWTSMITGVHPGKHGIFGFVKLKQGTYELDVVTSRDRRRPAIWNLLDAAGLTSIIVDVPFTYPPEAINGVMVSGLGTPDITRPFVHPEDLRPAVVRQCGAYPLEMYYRGSIDDFLAQGRYITRHRLCLAQSLFDARPWDFFMLGITAPDRLQHVLWKYLDPAHPLYSPDDAARHGPGILNYYRGLDDGIAEILDRLDDRTVFLLASDHGFGPLERNVSLLRWLNREGLAVLGETVWEHSPPERTQRFQARGPGRVLRRPDGTVTVEVDRADAFAGAVFRLTALDPRRRYEVRVEVADATPDALLELDDLRRRDAPIIGGGSVHAGGAVITALVQPRGARMDLFVGMTTYRGNPAGRMTIKKVTVAAREDWARTAAFVLDKADLTEGRRIRLNVRGREPAGVIEPGTEYERVRGRIIDGLTALRDARGRKLVSRVLKGEELYSGLLAADGPDLVVVFEEGVGGTDRNLGSSRGRASDDLEVPFEREFSGNHRPEGIFLARGPRVRPGGMHAASIVDICPTVLHLLGVPGPADLDGRPLTELFRDGPRAPVRAATAAAALDTKTAGDDGADPYAGDDRQIVEDRLRKLGYLD
jgi:predicted AlkP superfamily phosphohydrolase/phosphomutase